MKTKIMYGYLPKACLDYGLIIPVAQGSTSSVAIPWLGITLPIGKTQKKITR